MLGVIVTILTVILAFMCIVMSLVILMQRPKQEGLGAAFGGSLTDKMLGSGTTDFLQRATVIMGVAFFVLSLTIATLMAYDRNSERQAQLDQIRDVAGPGEAAADPALDVVPPAPDAGPLEVTTPPLTVPPIEATEPPANVDPALPAVDEIELPAAEDLVPPADLPPADAPPADGGEPPAGN